MPRLASLNAVRPAVADGIRTGVWFQVYAMFGLANLAEEAAVAGATVMTLANRLIV